MQDKPNKYDFIIIGAGSAGSVAAGVLAQRGFSVLLLDAGKPAALPDVWNPYDNNNLYGIKDIWWQNYKTPRYAGSSQTMKVDRSKLHGGCSAVNDMVYTRGAPADFERWVCEFGCQGWAYPDIGADFDYVEAVVKPTSAACADEFGLAFLEACHELGLPYLENYNADVPLYGVSPLCSTISEETVRETSFHSFFNGMNDCSDKISIVGEALVTKVILDKNKAIGVEYSINGIRHSAACEGEVILSAGAINSPKILMCSGIGDAEELKRFGIKVVVDNPLVGSNLQDAILFSLQWKTSKPLDVPPKAPNGNRRNEGYAIVWANLNEFEQPRTCIEMMPGLYIPHQPVDVLRNNYTITGGAMRLASRGWVKLASADPQTAPQINLNLFSEPGDMDEAMESFSLARAIGNSKALAPLRGEEIAPGPSVVSPEQIRTWILDNFYSYSHPSGTCKMGPSMDVAVVDNTLKVHGIENLRIADASIMPEITSGHTQAPSFMIGRKSAEFIISGR